MPHDDERDFAEEAANAAHMRDEHEPDTDKSDTDKSVTAEDRAWRAAYAVAWVGASNTAGVALSIHETIVSLRASGMPWADVDTHPAVRAMVGHLTYLTGRGLGPTMNDLATVREHGARLLDS
jgi:hypothetical protein